MHSNGNYSFLRQQANRTIKVCDRLVIPNQHWGSISVVQHALWGGKNEGVL